MYIETNTEKIGHKFEEEQGDVYERIWKEKRVMT